MTGEAPSLSDAIETYGNVARGITAILSVAANAAIEDPTADVAFETTVTADRREYWARNGPGWDVPPGIGRWIRPMLVKTLVEAFARCPDDKRDRFIRSIIQYHHAIQKLGARIRDCLLVAHLGGRGGYHEAYPRQAHGRTRAHRPPVARALRHGAQSGARSNNHLEGSATIWMENCARDTSFKGMRRRTTSLVMRAKHTSIHSVRYGRCETRPYRRSKRQQATCGKPSWSMQAFTLTRRRTCSMPTTKCRTTPALG